MKRGGSGLPALSQERQVEQKGYKASADRLSSGGNPCPRHLL